MELPRTTRSPCAVPGCTYSNIGLDSARRSAGSQGQLPAARAFGQSHFALVGISSECDTVAWGAARLVVFREDSSRALLWPDDACSSFGPEIAINV